MSKKPLIYVIAQNGMKIRVKPRVIGSLLRFNKDTAKACSLPIDILFPKEE